MEKQRVKIIELNYAANDYIVRSETDHLRSLYRGSLLECIAYIWLMDCEVVNKGNVKDLFMPARDRANEEPLKKDIDEPLLKEMLTEKRRLELIIKDGLSDFQSKYHVDIDGIYIDSVNSHSMDPCEKVIVDLKINIDL